MDGCIEGYYARWNKSDRKTNALWFRLHVESKNQKRKETNKIKEKQMLRHREQTGGCQRGADQAMHKTDEGD